MFSKFDARNPDYSHPNQYFAAIQQASPEELRMLDKDGNDALTLARENQTRAEAGSDQLAKSYARMAIGEIQRKLAAETTKKQGGTGGNGDIESLSAFATPTEPPRIIIADTYHSRNERK